MKIALALAVVGFETLAALAPQPTWATVVEEGGHARLETSAQGFETPRSSASQPTLTGKTVVIDAGHQLGNANFPAQINKLVSAGPSKKACNTTGTATASGYPEATFNFVVARRLKRLLTDQGATVVMVRRTNSADRWGPCIDVRGRAGNAIGADLKISIHADGNLTAGARGFHVIAPGHLPGWNDDIETPSASLAVVVKAAMTNSGFAPANYIAGGDGLDARTDLGTLNLSDIPTVMVECGNMRNAADAARMIRPAGQAAYARALAAGISRWLVPTSRREDGRVSS